MLTIAEILRAPQAIVFDCAGTLLKLDPSREAIFHDAARDIGLDLPLPLIARAYELVDFAVKMKSSELKSDSDKADFYRRFNAALCAALGISNVLDALHPRLTQGFATRRNWVAYEDAARVLKALRAHVPVHALANWDRGLDTVLRRAGLRDLIDDAVASETLGFEKPLRACFDAFLSRHALDPNRTIYVGNEYIADVVGSRAAGMIPVLIDRDDAMPAADCHRIRSLSELVA